MRKSYVRYAARTELVKRKMSPKAKPSHKLKAVTIGSRVRKAKDELVAGHLGTY